MTKTTFTFVADRKKSMHWPMLPWTWTESIRSRLLSSKYLVCFSAWLALESNQRITGLVIWYDRMFVEKTIVSEWISIMMIFLQTWKDIFSLTYTIHNLIICWNLRVTDFFPTLTGFTFYKDDKQQKNEKLVMIHKHVTFNIFIYSMSWNLSAMS